MHRSRQIKYKYLFSFTCLPFLPFRPALDLLGTFDPCMLPSRTAIPIRQSNQEEPHHNLLAKSDLVRSFLIQYLHLPCPGYRQLECNLFGLQSEADLQEKHSRTFQLCYLKKKREKILSRLFFFLLTKRTSTSGAYFC